MYGGKIGLKPRDEVADTRFVRVYFQIKERGNRCGLLRLDVGGTGAKRHGGERSKDAAVGWVCIEDHEGVVIDGVVIRRVERGDLHGVALTAGAEVLQVRLL